ncbi:MAG TPA: DNA translocase FtsK 4TM domain-containing protein [Gemmataceae bacterium]|nr:DNA translocase FtsK 4TM domain-containing protein [Gemmataceae bacterium]
MSERRAWRLDVVAFALLLTGMAVAWSAFAHDPRATANNPSTTSPIEDFGAWLGGSLYDALGVAVYFLLASWFALVVLLFLRRSLVTWSLRLAGWLLLLPCAAVTADFLGPSLLPGPVVGSGGSLGAWLNIWLDAQLTPVGRILVCASCLLLGLVLTADFVLIRALRTAWTLIRWLLAPMAHRWLLSIRRRTTVNDETLETTRPLRGSAIGKERQATGNGQIPIRHVDGTVSGTPPIESPPREPPPIVRPAPVMLDEERFADYELPALSLLSAPAPFPYQEHDQKLREKAALLEKTFTDFGLNVRVVGINTGPVITQYEVALETGLRVHKVTRLADDLALNLKVPSVRMVAPIPGKNTVGVEIPNEHRAVVRLKELIQMVGKRAAKYRIPLFLGKDTEGRPLVYDLTEMPHLLIAGRTGTGKSVCMNAIIISMLMTRRPDEVKMVMIDPKMLELSEYGKIPHLMHPVVKDM